MSERDELTDRQKEVLEFISESIAARGYPPTLREIGERMGIRSTNGVNDHLKALEKKGYLAREDLKSRALRPLKLPMGTAVGARPPGVTNIGPLSDDVVEVPVIGRVAAGAPLLAVENVEDTVKIDRFFLGGWGLGPRPVERSSPCGKGRVDDRRWDLRWRFHLREKVTDGRAGDIVVALIDDEATVKRYYPEGDVIRFQPANATMQPILVRRRDFKSVNLIGIVVGIYRKIR